MDTNRSTTSNGQSAPRSGKWVVFILLAFAVATWVALTQPAAPLRPDWSRVAKLWHDPVERNAFLRLPYIGLVSAVRFAPDGKHGWALSAGSSALATNDGGHTWRPVAKGLPMVSTLAMRADGRNGWAGGALGLFQSSNGMQDRIAVTDPVLKNKTWTSLAFAPSGQAGVAVATDGTYFGTENGGKTWRPLGQSGPSDKARPGKMLAATWSDDDKRGWVVGEGGRVGSTFNGGEFWSEDSIGIPPGTTLIQVHFLSGDERGWVIGSKGELFASTDSGRKWHRVESDAGSKFIDVQFQNDAEHGWALSEDGVFATNDGGLHWERRSRFAPSQNPGMHVAADGARILLYGDWGFRTSIDGGHTWQSETRNALNDIAAIGFGADGQKGWAVGEGGLIIHSGDGGASWVGQPPGTPANLQAVAVADDGVHAWAAGDAGTLLQTADAGNHWSTAGLNTKEDLRRIAFSGDGRRGVVMGRQGTIWISDDGGQNWRLPRSGLAPQELDDLSAQDDGKHLWVSTRGGNLFHSTDAGDTWQAAAWADFPGGAAFRVSGATELPRFGKDGQRAWLNRYDRSGCRMELVVNDGKPNAKFPGQPFNYPCMTLLAAFQGDGKIGWAVRPGSDFYITRDGGKTWEDALAPYRRWPGLWYWAALLFLAGGMLLALRTGRRPGAATSAVDMFADDDAITDFDDDRLEFGPLARGLSRFLRNPRTSPPLTLSITGDWGTGKSSLMRLLCADLRRYGQRPIWFNAWHHQKDEQLFSALLGTIQAQAAPSSWRPAGWLFRMKLLWIRSKRHVLMSFLVLLLLTVALTWQVLHGSDWGGIVMLFQSLGDAFNAPETPTVGDVGKHLNTAAPFIALVPVARFLYKGMQAFRGEPALMFKGLSDKLSLKQAGAQNTFRTTFGRQFEEVAAALPYRMTIVVDDLDRCRPENILEVLETVNFLTASGQCFVVFGMATERVEAALRMAFEKVAAEMDPLIDHVDVAELDDPAARAKQRRRVYARDYLEKLINLEIKVPERGATGAEALFSARKAQARSMFKITWMACAAYWPLWMAAVAICAGIYVGRFDWTVLSRSTTVAAPVASMSKAAAAATTATAAAEAATKEATASRSALIESMKKREGVVQAGQSSSLAVAYGPSILAALCLVGFAVIHGLLRRHAQAIQAKDTEAFREGMKIWTELAASRRTTPRAIKRWGNRLRYFAMLQQGVVEEPTRVRRVERAIATMLRAWHRQRARRGMPGRGVRNAGARLRQLLVELLTAQGPTSAAAPPAGYTIIEEGRLIAIGAAHEAYQAGWREALASAYRQPGDDLVSKAIRRYAEVTGTAWRPISDAEAQAFDRLLAGIKMPAADGVPSAAVAGSADAALLGQDAVPVTG